MKKITSLVLITFLAFILSFSGIGAQSATDEANGVSERVKEKVEAAKKKPKAYIGSVTDKTEDTLQIQNDSGEIQLISIDPESASFAKIDKKTTSADYDDIGIGDYVIAMGFANGNDVLEAKRVVITSQPEPSNIQVIHGTIETIEKKEVTIITKTGEFDLEFPKKWTGPEISELDENIPLISIGVVEGNIINIRTIHIATPPSNTEE
jgi:hypothetical protein